MALAAAVLLGFAEFAPVSAQIVYGAGFTYTARGHHGRVVGFVGGFTVRPGYPYSGGTYFYPGYGPGWRPGSGNPYFLPPPGGLAPPPYGPSVFGPPWYYPPPIIIANPPLIIVVANPNLNGGVVPIGPPVVQHDPPRGNPEGGPPGAKPGQFIVITPKKDVQQAAANPMIPDGAIVPAAEKVMAPEPQRLPRFDPFAGPPMGNIEKREADPQREFARLLKLAQQAFAEEEYGRAIDFLDRAANARPADALPHFLKAQSYIAAGQYAEALDAIRSGMKLNPDWPTAGIRPRDLYAVHPERFDGHVAALRLALAENPGDSSLQFLLGYELWFSGKRDEAIELFRAAQREPLAAQFLKHAAKR